ncbi:MAG: CYTH domain-containing protein [Oscillibacter sp.]|nr:CYTH domain-containing protein [Oscillibacter sp.]
MMQEIERKFLVKGDGFKRLASTVLPICQGYLSSVPERSVRIRLRGEKAYLTVKGMASRDGLSRFEWEKEIFPHEAEELIKLCEPGVIEKSRYLVPAGKHTYEVDEFHGDNEGLVVAEIELSTPEEEFIKPEWLGKEVTGDLRYYNSSLTKNPYKNWRGDE